jgi:hypothetical protein
VPRSKETAFLIRSGMKKHNVSLGIEPADPYKKFLELIVYDWAGVSDNIAYHLSYLEYLYQLMRELPLKSYPVLNGLRLKTIIGEIASCVEVLLYDAVVHLSVVDAWRTKKKMTLDTRVGFRVLLAYAFMFGVVNKPLNDRIHKLFDLRNKIHLTHGKRDPYIFNDSLLKDSEKTLEDLFRHFVRNRQRNISGRVPISEKDILLPWNRI